MFPSSIKDCQNPLLFPHHSGAMSQVLLILCFFLFLPIFQALPEPEPVEIHPFHSNPSPPATIPAFPEQSDVARCPLELPDELFHGIKTACSAGKGAATELRRSRCCPVLAAWLYAAYSGTALGRAKRGLAAQTASYDLPLLPDDSETCVDDLEKSLKSRGVELVKPNETCDVVYCFCGIRLHPLSCPEAFSVSPKGKLVGDQSVKKLERDCLSTKGFPGLGGCSKCLNALYLLKDGKTGNSSKMEARSRKMHSRDCELMGLTWLLAKNRTAYIHTVSTVLRAIMMNTDGSDPQSCTLNSDGMPLAVDSAEISSHSASTSLRFSIPLAISSLSFLYAHLTV